MPCLFPTPLGSCPHVNIRRWAWLGLGSWKRQRPPLSRSPPSAERLAESESCWWVRGDPRGGWGGPSVEPALGGHGLPADDSPAVLGDAEPLRGLTSSPRIVLTQEPDTRLRLLAQVFRCSPVRPGALWGIARWHGRSCVNTLGPASLDLWPSGPSSSRCGDCPSARVVMEAGRRWAVSSGSMRSVRLLRVLKPHPL